MLFRSALRRISSACPACAFPARLHSSAYRPSPTAFESAPPPPPLPSIVVDLSRSSTPSAAAKVKGKGRIFQARKAAIELVRHHPAALHPTGRPLLTRLFPFPQSPTAVDRIKDLLASPKPQLIRIGVRNKGCAGMSYHLEYVDKPDRFDEVVEQDGVKVVVDSKALFSVIGSQMDWQEDALGAKFVFKSESQHLTRSGAEEQNDDADALAFPSRPEYQGCVWMRRVSLRFVATWLEETS